jgi:hypothetical protein
VNRLVQSNNKFNAVAAGTVFLLAYSMLVARASMLLRDPDTMYHIHTGLWILEHGQVPHADFYSYTAFGKPWISTEWFAQVLYAIAFKFGGWRAVAVVAAAACAAIIGILCFYLLRQLRFSIAVGCAVLTVIATGPHFLARPHIFAYVILAVWVISLLDAYDDKKFDLPPLKLLAPLMVLWANFHGSFTFGLTLLYVFAAFCLYRHFLDRNYAKCRRIVIVPAVVTACACITPYGLLPFLMTTRLLSMKFSLGLIAEWRSPNFQESYFTPVYLVGILSAIAGFGIRLNGPGLVAFAITTLTGLRYVRGLLMFFFVIPAILARPAGASSRYLAPLLPDAKSPESADASDPALEFLHKRAKPIFAICAALAVLLTASTIWRNDVVPPKAITPKAALDFVRRTNITGNVFNSYQFGGYLIFSGIPTFIDGRAELYGDAFVRKYAETENIVDINSAFDLLDEYKVNWVLLAPKEPLAKALGRNEPWDQVYSDEDAVVFVRRH